jgi:hypothetical protein
MKSKPGRKPKNIVPDVQDGLQGMDQDRLMTMPLEELDALLAREEKVQADKDRLIEEIKATRKIEFFKPIDPYQSKVLEHIHNGKTVVTMQGANAIGKTTVGAVVVGSACLGIQPWDGKDTRWGNKPVRCRILCTDWEKHAATVVVPKLKEWLPLGEYETSKNNLGIESNFKFRNGSNIEIVTGKQDTRDLEGWEGDIVWADEPFGRDKFIALLRGLRRGNGLFLITMTAVSEAWILDDIVRNPHPSYASVTEIPMDSNPYLTKEYKETFTASLKENEKIPRIYGGWLNLVGLIWPGFRPEIHIVDDFKVPTDWPIIPMIDFHPKEPQAIGFYATDPQERWYVVDEMWKHMTSEETADEIIRAKLSNAWRINDVFIDPLSKGDTAYIKQRGVEIDDAYTVIKERLWKHGIDLHVFSRDKSSGILNVEKLLMGPNKMPLLFFMRSLTNKIKEEGHIWEIQRWVYDENQKPKDENDHFMQCLYAMTLTGIKYTKMVTGTRTSEIDFNPLADHYGIVETETEFQIYA